MENVKATWKYIISTPPPLRTLPSFNRPSLYHSNSSNRDAHIPSPSHLWPFRDWAHAVPTPLVMMMTGVHLSCYMIIKDNIQYLTINSREKIQIHDIAINSKKWRKRGFSVSSTKTLEGKPVRNGLGSWGKGRTRMR